MALTWLKKGAESASIAKQDQLDYERRKEESGKMFRFWLNKGDSAKVTFVDGDLDPTAGVLLPPRYYEHTIMVNGDWVNFVCPEKTNPESGEKCPFCATNDRPSLVALFTIIDHRTSYGKNDKTKVYQNQRRLYVAKSTTFEILNKLAAKRGGLAGLRIEISRVGDKSPGVGDTFDCEEKLPIDQLQASYQMERTDPKTNAKVKTTAFLPADYEKEIVYRTGEELVKMGFGGPQVPGAVASPAGQAAPTVDYSNQL
jgi:hypothetical protein